jgi:nucleolin
MTDRATGRSKGFGYVEYASASSAKAALEAMSGKELDGRALNVDYSTPRPERSDNTNDRASKFGDQRSAESDTVFVANLSFDVDEDIVRNEFEKFGEIIGLRLPTDPYVSLLLST